MRHWQNNRKFALKIGVCYTCHGVSADNFAEVKR